LWRTLTHAPARARAHQISKLKDLKKWGVWGAIRAKVDQFRQTMPLIQDLKNPALRPRHWKQLKSEIQEEFDAKSADFTLERVFALGLHNHAEFIGELSANANKELAIETALDTISKAWAVLQIQMGTYKEVYSKVTTTEELYTQLEDNQVQLSTMKSSKFYAAFEGPITFWERTLARISEIMDLLLLVQRQWMYLESIFMSSEDIRKQLPSESALFDQVRRRGRG
jgi:dynein heavy chain, axonemal